MTARDTTNSEKLGVLPYVIGGMAFIPLIGVLFGVAAIAWGLATNKSGGKRLAAIGAGGIGFTVVLYGALFYFGFAQRGGIYDDLRTQLAQRTINELVPWIEMFKLEHGRYPASLEVLQSSVQKYGFVSVVDPSAGVFERKSNFFFYERTGAGHYYLRGVGPDGKPFTDDDIVPQIPVPPGSRLGLLTQAKGHPLSRRE